MSEKSEKAAEKATDKKLEAVESHVHAGDTEMPDHAAQRAVEAHRQAQVGRREEVSTGDDSAVDPQPDRDAPGMPVKFSAEPDGERQVTEQPDRYAVGDEAAEYAVEANSKNRRTARQKKKADELEEQPSWPAQYADVKAEDVHPAQYSW